MNIRKISLCALFTALLSICAWLAVPLGDIYITMQTFGIFLCLLLLGGKYGTVSILTYLLLGAVGLPVFSGFRGGLGVLIGPTGGYIWGFAAASLLYWLLTSLFHRSFIRWVSLLLGLVLCYSLGSFWYVYTCLDPESISFLPVVGKCVLPYILPDLLKLSLALALENRLARSGNFRNLTFLF